MYVFFLFILLVKKIESNPMDWIQIFDQLVAFNKPLNKTLFWKHLITISTFILSCLLSELCLFNRYHGTLCKGINSFKYIIIPPLEIYLFACS